MLHVEAHNNKPESCDIRITILYQTLYAPLGCLFAICFTGIIFKMCSLLGVIMGPKGWIQFSLQLDKMWKLSFPTELSALVFVFSLCPRWRFPTEPVGKCALPLVTRWGLHWAALLSTALQILWDRTHSWSLSQTVDLAAIGFEACAKPSLVKIDLYTLKSARFFVQFLPWLKS